MNIFSFLLLFGGLALFLFGITVMGEGLEKLTGGKLEKILEKFSNTPIKGVALGIVVTGIIQSSSATTVMVVGFVNSGIMQLSQTVGIIMGANIGTTSTAWILSLGGIQSDNIFMQMLKPDNFSLLFAAVGAVLYVFFKSGKKPVIGQILLGFTVLIYGMHMMSESVAPLKDSPGFLELMKMVDNPKLGFAVAVIGVLIGAVVTGIIQSSTASIGMLQAIMITNPMKFSIVFPIILGQNIGTCATALLASIGTNKNARRAALIHLYFNGIGTIIFLVLMYTLNFFIKFPFWDSYMTPAYIAATHSTFNIFCTIVFFPFIKGFEKLACMTIKDKPNTGETVEVYAEALDERFLSSPSFALEQCHLVVLDMARTAEESIHTAFDMLWDFKPEVKDIILKNETKIDILQDKISDYLINLTNKNLTTPESRNISKYLQSINDFERIGDHAENIFELAENMYKNGVKFSPHAKKELEIIINATNDILNMAIQSFYSDDIEFSADVEPLEEVIDLICDTLKTRHVERLKNGECSIEAGIAFNDLIANFERISDHCSNIALYIIELKAEQYKSHEYTHRIKEGGQGYFQKKYDEYIDKYHVFI